MESMAMGADPSEQGGYREVQQREIKVSVVDELGGKQKNFEDLIMFRAFRKGDSQLKLEMTSQVNIFFFYAKEMNDKMYQQLSEEEGLTVNLMQFPKWIDQLLMQPNTMAQFVISGSRGTLFIRQKSQLKILRIAKIEFEYQGDDRVKESLMYRYSRMKMRKQQLNDILYKANSLLKTKNPSLLLQFQKNYKTQAFK